MNCRINSGATTVESFARLKTIAYCVTLALAQWGLAGAAHADSAVGQNTTLGNAQHPAPVNPVAEQTDGFDPDGMSVHDYISHSPSGLMYNIPNNDADLKDTKAPEFNASIEAGVIGIGGDKDAALFRQYKDVRKGPVVDSFSVQGITPDSASYMEATGGGIGRDDQFYGLQFGKYNEWKVKAFYNEILHVFTTTAKPIWDGVGTNVLTLKGGIPAGAGVTTVGQDYDATCTTAGAGTTPCFIAPAYGFNTPTTAAALTAAATTTTNGGVHAQQTRALMALQRSMGYSELSLVRQQAGLGLDTRLTDSWKFFTTATTEKRKGARPIGITDAGFSDIMEAAEPINYTTTDFKAGVRYRDKLTSFNVVASANFFHDAYDAMTVDNPFLAGTAPSQVLEQKAVFSLPPSNQAYGILAELARGFPDFLSSRLNGTVAWNTSRQNEQLLPWSSLSGQGTTNPGTAGSFNGNFDEWNQSPGKADARIDTKLADLKFSLRPQKKLSVAAKVRYFETDNKTNYVNCNPNATYGDGTQYTAWGCTGVWGYMGYDYNASLLNNRGVTSGYIPTTAGLASNKWLRNVPWDRKEFTPGVTLDYQLGKFSSANLSLERETIKRTNRERDKTWEDKIKLGYTNRAIAAGTLRLSYENDRRRGSDYNSSPYVAQFSGLAFIDPSAIPAGTALTTYFVTIGDLRKSDVADRDQNILNARFNYALMEGLDLGSTLQWRTTRYNESTVGRQKQDQQTLGVDLNYQVVPDTVWYVNYAYQDGKFRQANVQNGRPAAQPASYACTMGTVTPWGTITPDTAAQICNMLANNISWAPINAESVDTNDTNHMLGLGVKMALGKSVLDVNVNHTRAVTQTKYNYDPNGTGVAAALQPLAGDGMPDLVTRITTVSASLLVPIEKNLSARVAAGLEMGHIEDWHYTGLENNGSMVTGVQNNPVYIDAGPQNYRVRTVGVMFKYKM
jgi:Putative outer membrane beta-barrel porin, MtrB/PioB